MAKVTVTVTSTPDGFGRQRFCSAWPANNVGPHCNEQGNRQQLSFGNVAEHVARWKARGFEVEVVDQTGRTS